MIQAPVQQLEFFDIPSPCIGVCQSGPRGYCLGCFRSREERLYWQQLDDGVRRTIIRACQQRKRRALARQRAGEQPSSIPEQGAFWDDEPSSD
ncbi:DUF1289 domain-containing protein [Aestuariibacter halophilus]|uniref:DUF1289 domain-containing protein n=1 Tax=Fluctibacter halophilus TaxID=226011 RepID=A0ABS8G9T7_9ALTE|nr:DUF1289 domain-containing protein [Aestuariibacter halophilus]MCC2616479.1 DUF1289 domain-containing protein [Aestuariibacter halophilus]